MKALTVEELSERIKEAGATTGYIPPALIAKVLNAYEFKEKDFGKGAISKSQGFTLVGSDGTRIRGFSGADRVDLRDYIGKVLLFINQKGQKGHQGLMGEMHAEYGPQLKIKWQATIFEVASGKLLNKGAADSPTMDDVVLPEKQHGGQPERATGHSTPQAVQQPLVTTEGEILNAPVTLDDILAEERGRAAENWFACRDLVIAKLQADDAAGIRAMSDVTPYELSNIVNSIADAALRRLTSVQIEVNKKRKH